MKAFVVKSLEALAVAGFFVVIASGAWSGYARAAWGWGYSTVGGPLVGLLLGALIGFVIAVVVFGLLFLVMDIADNTRRTRELIEAEAAARRTP